MKYSMYFIVQMSTIRSSGKEVEGNSSAETTEGINQIGMWIEHCSSYLKLNALWLFLKTTVTLITAIRNFAITSYINTFFQESTNLFIKGVLSLSLFYRCENEEQKLNIIQEWHNWKSKSTSASSW